MRELDTATAQRLERTLQQARDLEHSTHVLKAEYEAKVQQLLQTRDALGQQLEQARDALGHQLEQARQQVGTLETTLFLAQHDLEARNRQVADLQHELETSKKEVARLRHEQQRTRSQPRAGPSSFGFGGASFPFEGASQSRAHPEPPPRSWQEPAGVYPRASSSAPTGSASSSASSRAGGGSASGQAYRYAYGQALDRRRKRAAAPPTPFTQQLEQALVEMVLLPASAQPDDKTMASLFRQLTRVFGRGESKESLCPRTAGELKERQQLLSTLVADLAARKQLSGAVVTQLQQAADLFQQLRRPLTDDECRYVWEVLFNYFKVG